MADQGVRAIAATTIRARQRVGGYFSKLAHRFRPTKGVRLWILPNGESVELFGEKRTNLMLVWSEDQTSPIDETGIRSRWPESPCVRKVGDNLVLVEVADSKPTNGGVVRPVPLVSPREVAEQVLASARETGDRGNEASALTDLGILLNRDGNTRLASEFLEQALAITREVGDLSRQCDVLGNLGLAAPGSGLAGESLNLFQQEVEHALSAADPIAEKLALDHLGLAHSNLHDPSRALASYTKALDLARKIGDRQHEADLVWNLGIEHAELGQHDQAVARGQETLSILRQLGSPVVGEYANLLQRFRTEHTAPRPIGSDRHRLG